MNILLRAIAVLGGIALLTLGGLLAYHMLGRGGDSRAGNLPADRPALARRTSSGERPESGVPVRVAMPRRGTVTDEIRQSASLASASITPIFAPIAGIVRSVQVEEGDRLRAGAVLIQLDDREWRLNLAQSRVALDRDTAEWKRRQAIRSEALEDRAEYREARHNFQTRRLTLDQRINERKRKEAEAGRIEISFREKLASAKERDDVRYALIQARLEEEEARVQLARATGEWERIQALDARSLMDEAAHTQAKFAYQAAQAALNLAALKVKQARITTPVAGVVTERAVKAGDYVSSNARLMTLADLNRLEAVVHLPEMQWTRVRPGHPVRVLPEALPGTAFTGRVERVSPVVDAENGTFKVTIAVNNPPGGRLRPGMFAVLHIRTAVREAALLIPRRAVLGDEEARYVFVIDEGGAAQRAVVLGTVTGEAVEVVRGLSESDRVVVAGQHRLRPGVAVKVMK